MQKISLIVLVALVFQLKASAFNNIKSAYTNKTKDTIYIYIKTEEDLKHSRTKPGFDYSKNKSLVAFDVYGYTHEKNIDFLDSLGFKGISIFLQQDTLSFCITQGDKQNVEKKMITLIQLRDTLKTNPGLAYMRLHKHQIFGTDEQMKNTTFILVIDDGTNYCLRKVKFMTYFHKAGDGDN